jgi:purine-binding chemotaxis protein CheW
MADFAGVRFLLFRVADVVCAAEVRSVREIVPFQGATRIPGAPGQVLGLVNVRGSLITLVDCRQAIGLPSGDRYQSIVLLDVGDRIAGLAVDEVVDMVAVPPDDLASRGQLAGIASQFVRAVGRYGDTSFVLLDTDALFRPVMPI